MAHQAGKAPASQTMADCLRDGKLKGGTMLNFLMCLIIGHKYKNRECQRCGKEKRKSCSHCGLAAKADPRCEGGNCTFHCKLHCSIDCVREWAEDKRAREEFTERM